MKNLLLRNSGLIATNRLCVATLLPFINKPFHIDDPLYLWTAQHIRAHPTDPFGFEVNWYGWKQPMSDVINNPPLVPYYLALASMALGWREAAMHGALLVPALGAGSRPSGLARLRCPRP